MTSFFPVRLVYHALGFGDAQPLQPGVSGWVSDL